MERNLAVARARYVAAAAGTIAVGLAVHGSAHLGALVKDVAGDALWSMMVVWWISAIGPRTRLDVRLAAALAFSFAVEFSQLSPAPLLEAARAALLGYLVLGRGFDPRDLGAYAVGVASAGLIDCVWRSLSQPAQR